MSCLLQLENKGVEELLQPFIGKVDAKPEADLADYTDYKTAKDA